MVSPIIAYLFLPNLCRQGIFIAGENNKITASCQVSNIYTGFGYTCIHRNCLQYAAIHTNYPDKRSMAGDRAGNRNRGIAGNQAGVYIKGLSIYVIERNNTTIVNRPALFNRLQAVINTSCRNMRYSRWA